VNIARLMGGKLKRSSLMKPVKELVVVDESTVKFILNEPFGAFINTVAHPGALMLSPAAIAKYGDQREQEPRRDGPLHLCRVGFRHGQDQKNPGYWGGAVKVRLHQLPADPGKRLPGGHAARGPGPLHLPHAAEMLKVVPGRPQDRDHRAALHRRTLPDSEHPLRAAVRPARAPGRQLRLDKQAIIRIAWGGAATEADSIIPPNLQFYKKQSPWPYDLAKAKALMKEAGFENGFKVVFLTPNPSNGCGHGNGAAAAQGDQHLRRDPVDGRRQLSTTSSKPTGRTTPACRPSSLSAGGPPPRRRGLGIRPLLATRRSRPPFPTSGFSPTRKWTS